MDLGDINRNKKKISERYFKHKKGTERKKNGRKKHEEEIEEKDDISVMKPRNIKMKILGCLKCSAFKNSLVIWKMPTTLLLNQTRDRQLARSWHVLDKALKWMELQLPSAATHRQADTRLN
ncbi:hypothetical protein CDAR_78311 [Caerostris darwini]|uniref:Uncharacterized protein n=1 Tax=Caerostris darwini TaxID=1538125 RepID=A0AAV4SBF2_9ARAC|nr:hypothetical protein CDAR_78311 [Caerostris darwini]